MPRSKKVALAWVADMLQEGWEIWNPDKPDYWRLRLATRHGDPEYNRGVVAVDMEDGVALQRWSSLLAALVHMSDHDSDYFSETELDEMLEALEYGNTVPFRKWMRKI